MTVSWWFCSKDETDNFNSNIVSTNAFKFSKHKTKLIGSTVAPNEILENAAIAVPLSK